MQSPDQQSSQELDQYLIKDEMQPQLSVNYNQCSTEQQIAANLLLNYSNQNYANNITIMHNHELQNLDTECAVGTTVKNGLLNGLNQVNNNNNKNNIQHKLPNILQRQRIFSDLDVHNYAFNGTNSHYSIDDATMNPSQFQTPNVELVDNELMSPIKSLKFVAVHLGAGSYCANNQDELRKLAKEVCENVMRLSKDHRHNESMATTPTTKKHAHTGNKNHKNNLTKKSQSSQDQEPKNMNAITAATQLIKQLEDHHLLNCGFGSNLNMKGHVECDASLMSDKPRQLWSGVGAVSGCKNPIMLAKHLYDQQTIPRPLQLVQPNLLVGQGAKQWMREHCPQLAVADSQLISQRSLRVYSKLKSQYDESVRSKKLTSSNSIDDYHDTEGSSSNALLHPTEFDHGFYCRRSMHAQNSNFDRRLDTVGAVAIDCDNNIASAISSGGVLLKHNGRVGQAAIPGAGCWAQKSIGVTTSGVGEYLTVTLFAKKIHERLNTIRNQSCEQPLTTTIINQELTKCFEEELLESLSLTHIDMEYKQAGFLAVMQSNLEDGLDQFVLTYGHNTSSMCIGFMSSDDTEGHSRISTKKSGTSAKPGRAHIESVKINI